MPFILSAILAISTIGPQTTQTQVFELKRFEVIRVNPDALQRVPRSMRFIFSDPLPDGERVNNVEEATKRAGFSPRLISGKTPARVFVTNGVNEEAKISVDELKAALRDAKVDNVTVPADWEGKVISLQQRPGILADYGDFYVAQAAPSALRVPAGFPLVQFMEVLFRLLGLNATEARTLRDQFAANAAAFMPIPPRFDMEIRQVPMASGSGLLLQNAEKGGELAFMWSTGDRSYFLTGAVTEDEVIAIGKSLQ
jgi:hypothetical protein